MKLLITGSAGFVGSNLTEYLLNKNHSVLGIDNFNDFYDPKVKHYHIREFANHPNFSLYNIDLNDLVSLEDVFSKNADINTVVHLAAWPGVTKSFDIPTVYVKNNIEATVNVLEMCKKYSVNNFIFASTSSIYGDGKVPFEETMSTDFPLAPYPATKKACEVMLYSYAKNFGINTSILRIFNPNGKRLRPDLAIPKLIKSCLYNTEFPLYWSEEESHKIGRDFCYVEHILEAIETIAANPFEYEIFNLGNSAPVTIAELIQTVQEVTGKQANVVHKPSRKGEMQLTYSNNQKAQKMIGYNPTTSISKIVEIYYDWFLQQEDWYKQLQTV